MIDLSRGDAEEIVWRLIERRIDFFRRQNVSDDAILFRVANSLGVARDDPARPRIARFIRAYLAGLGSPEELKTFAGRSRYLTATNRPSKCEVLRSEQRDPEDERASE